MLGLNWGSIWQFRAAVRILMAKHEKKTSGAVPPSAKGFNVVTLLGVIVTVAGVFLWRHGNGLGPGTGDRYWWAGVAALVIGLHVCFFSTMTKDQVLEWIRSEVVALSLALLIRWVVAEPYRIIETLHPQAQTIHPHGTPGRKQAGRHIIRIRLDSNLCPLAKPEAQCHRRYDALKLRDAKQRRSPPTNEKALGFRCSGERSNLAAQRLNVHIRHRPNTGLTHEITIGTEGAAEGNVDVQSKFHRSTLHT